MEKLLLRLKYFNTVSGTLTTIWSFIEGMSLGWKILAISVLLLGITAIVYTLIRTRELDLPRIFRVLVKHDKPLNSDTFQTKQVKTVIEITDWQSSNGIVRQTTSVECIKHSNKYSYRFIPDRNGAVGEISHSPGIITGRDWYKGAEHIEVTLDRPYFPGEPVKLNVEVKMTNMFPTENEFWVVEKVTNQKGVQEEIEIIFPLGVEPTTRNAKFVELNEKGKEVRSRNPKNIVDLITLQDGRKVISFRDEILINEVLQLGFSWPRPPKNE